MLPLSVDKEPELAGEGQMFFTFCQIPTRLLLPVYRRSCYIFRMPTLGGAQKNSSRHTLGAKEIVMRCLLILQLFVLTAACSLTLCWSAAAQTPVLAANDEKAIREIVQKYVAAREASDPKAIEALFTKDADQLVSDGTHRKGREELVRGMLESSKKTGGQRSITVESIRPLTEGVAVVDGRYVQTGLAGGSQRDMRTTLILIREAAGWRIAAIRNMLPAPSVGK
jgi:uncharacterized protein (TIGR02246 family)